MKTFKYLAVLTLAFILPLGAKAQGFMKTVATLNDLRLVQPDPNYPNVVIMGWAAAGDGGWGVYKWTSPSVLTTNYGAVASAFVSTTNTVNGVASIIVGSGDGGQWLRQQAGGNAAARTQTLVAATQVIPESLGITVAGTSGATTLTGTPQVLTNGVTAGQLIHIRGTSDTDTVIFTDNGTAAGSALELGASTRTLGIGDSLVLRWNATVAKWYEVSFANP